MVELTLRVDLAIPSSLPGAMLAAMVVVMVLAMGAVAALQEDVPQEALAPTQD